MERKVILYIVYCSWSSFHLSQQKTWVWPLANTYTWGERKKKEREEKQLHTQISTSIDTYSNVDKPYIHTTQSETVIIEGDFYAKECF